MFVFTLILSACGIYTNLNLLTAKEKRILVLEAELEAAKKDIKDLQDFAQRCLRDQLQE